MSEFLASNDWKWRLARTIVQGVLGVLIANLDLIMGWCVLDPSMRGLVVARCGNDTLRGQAEAVLLDMASPCAYPATRETST